MEIVMRFNGSSYETAWGVRNRASVCAEVLREEIFLPEGTPKIYAVFTAKRVPNAFRIESPDDDSGLSELAGVDKYILSWTRKTLAKAYNNGFRYVRIEY